MKVKGLVKDSFRIDSGLIQNGYRCKQCLQKMI